MRRIIAAICTSAALLLIAASMAMNWTFWTGQEPDAASANVLGAVLVEIGAAFGLFLARLPLPIDPPPPTRWPRKAPPPATRFLRGPDGQLMIE